LAFLYLVAVFSSLTLSCFLTFTALFFVFFMVDYITNYVILLIII
jgi:hypothetical protein